MAPRDPSEASRAATPLELFFDLAFVVAIATAGSHLHHALSADHVGYGVLSYVMVFFAIWWAWMGFTWFASAYDPDDLPYRLKVFVQITGVLVLAAGVPRAFEHWDFSLIVLGYVIMRVGLVAQWWRAGLSDPPRRRTAMRYIIGMVLLQCCWVGLLWVPRDFMLFVWVLLALLELAVPAWAERAAPTTWHPHHISERYGLLALIVMGESILAVTLAIQSAIEGATIPLTLWGTIVGSLLIVFSMWWLYFGLPAHRLLTSVRMAFIWGYAHLIIFMCIAAVGSGLAAAVDLAMGKSSLPAYLMGLSIGVPVALFAVTLAALFGGRVLGWRASGLLVALAVLLMLASAPLEHAPLVIGVILVALASGVSVLARRKEAVGS
jgi:low temperature requirement protein LtrA